MRAVNLIKQIKQFHREAIPKYRTTVAKAILKVASVGRWPGTASFPSVSLNEYQVTLPRSVNMECIKSAGAIPFRVL